MKKYISLFGICAVLMPFSVLTQVSKDMADSRVEVPLSKGNDKKGLDLRANDNQRSSDLEKKQSNKNTQIDKDAKPDYKKAKKEKTNR